MRWFILLFVVVFLFSGCAEQATLITSQGNDCQQELDDLKSYNSQLQERIDDLEKENTDMRNQLDNYYFTQITSDVDLLDWNAQEIMRGMILYNPKFAEGGWWTYFYHLDTRNYYYQEGGVFPEDPFFQLRYKNSGQEYNVSHLRIINIALGNRTLGDEGWKAYLGKALRETQVDEDLTCYQQTACRQIQVIKCNKNNQKFYAWSEGTNLFVSRNDEEVALDTFQRFYCTQK